MGALVSPMSRLPTARKFAFAGFALLCLAIILQSTGQLQAQDSAVVLLEPQTLTLDKGQVDSVVVRIEGAADVYGVQIELSFDAGKIKVLDVDEAKSGVQVLAGDFLALDEGFVVANEVDNESGHLSYALTLLAPAEPASGSGTLVEFKVEALETGSSNLLFGTVILASPEGAQLPVQLPDDPVKDGNDNEPKATATETAQPAAQATEDSPVTTTPTAENILTPSSPVESTIGVTPTAASSVVENTRLPTTPETATLTASGDSSTITVPVQTPVEEANPTTANPSAIEAANIDQETEIAAAAQPVENEGSIQVEAVPSPALTVIGQNRNSDEIQAQLATPAPTANSEGIMEGTYIAIGLLLLVVALIALWFLRRLLSKS